MNVGIVVPGFSASEKDWCIPALLGLVARLSESHRVRVFALRYPHREGSYPVFGAEVHAMGGADVRGLARISLLRRALFTVYREHLLKPFDVLHAVWADEPGYVAVRSARRLGIPSVVTVFGGELVDLPEISYGGLRSRLNRLLVARALRGASRVTVGSTTVAELVRSLASVEFLPVGVDLARFCPGERVSGLLVGDPKLLYVASLVPVKDPHTLLKAFARVSRVVSGASLNVVGEGPLENELRHLSRELEIDEHVVFHGAVPHDALPPYYRTADLVVMSSLHEGQGLVTLEAAACGRTTVGTRVGVVRDLEPATIAVPVGDVAALAEGIAGALTDRPRLRARETMVRNKVVAEYSLDKTVSALESLYRSVSGIQEQVARGTGCDLRDRREPGPGGPDDMPSSWGWGPTSLKQKKDTVS